MLSLGGVESRHDVRDREKGWGKEKKEKKIQNRYTKRRRAKREETMHERR